VRDIRERRNDIHRTLLRGTNPGHKLRKILGYRLERRLVRAMSAKKKPRPRQLSAARPAAAAGLQRLVRRVTRRSRRLAADWATRWRSKQTGGGEETEDYGEFENSIRSGGSTPRLIVDKYGTLRWPPVKLGQSDPASKQVLDSDNFMLKMPSSDNSSSPCVLGWLQVKSDSHVFTPAVEEGNGPFRKAPFHPHLHVLKTKV